MRFFFRINGVSRSVNSEPVVLDLILNDSFNTKFELDTGSHISTIKYSDAMRVGAEIHPTSVKAIAYGGANIKFIGEADIIVNYSNISKLHKFIIIDSNHSNLFGRDLCMLYDIKIDLPSDNCNNVSELKSAVVNKFSDYF